ncbi:MAG TPA: hypothetical protein VGI84_11480 [Pseudonocardiaceae bacterium]
MRIVGCGLIAVAALLGPAPVAGAAQLATPAGASAHAVAQNAQNAGSAQSTTAPQDEVSLLAVTLTAGGALAAAGSGVALAVGRRREVSRRPSQESG